MKTLSNLLGLLLVTLLMNTTNAANVVPVKQENDIDKVECNTSLSGLNQQPGQILVVNLPEVEIVATRLDHHALRGINFEGQIIPTIDLPSVEIIGFRSPVNKVRTAIINGELMFLAELPLIEITGNFPSKKLQLASKSGMPIVNLNEILIVENRIIDSELIALGEGENTDNEFEQYTILHAKDVSAIFLTQTASNTMKHINSEWFYVTLKKCGIHITGDHMYSIMTSSKVIATHAVRNQLNYLVNQ